MSRIEAEAYARMLDAALARYQRNHQGELPVRLPKVTSYSRLAAMLREWDSFTGEAVLLRDSGSAVRLGSVAELTEEPWPPRGVLAAVDGTWVLEQDGSVTRLY
jgi:hypothetical protein